MNPLSVLVLVSLGFMVQWTAAQGSAQVSSATLPSCAVNCLAAAVPTSTCSLTNQTCICSTKSLQQEVEACVHSSCTIKETLHAKNVTSTICEFPIRDRGDLYNRINITFGVISGIFFLARLYFKIFIAKTEFWLDDWFIIVAFFTAIPSTVMNTQGLVAHGLGRDIWTLDYDTITDFVKFFYIMEIMYFTHVPMLKISILFFYLRIFIGTTVHRILYSTLVVTCIFGIVFLFTVIFQCSPVSYYWTLWDGEHHGTCLNINAAGWSNAAISIALDFWMLAIPLSQLSTLHLHWKKKIGIALMFIVGALVTVVSILRLQSLVHFSNSSNPTWDQWDVANWSTIEINLGIICACMPAARKILVKLFPRILGTGTTRKGAQTPYAGVELAGNSTHRRGGTGWNSSQAVESGTVKHDDPNRSRSIVCERSYRVEYDEFDERQLGKWATRDSSQDNLKSCDGDTPCRCNIDL